MEDIFTFVLAIVLLVLFVTDWIATYVLRRVYLEAPTKNIALRERAYMALVLTLASTINAGLAVSRLFEIRLGGTVLIFLSISLILGSVPNLYWLYLYYSNRLRK